MFLIDFFKFIFHHFFAIISLAIAAGMGIGIFVMDDDDDVPHRMTFVLLYVLFLVYSIITWNSTEYGMRLLTTLVKCVVPAIITLFVSFICHSMSGDAIVECVITTIAYTVLCVLARIFNNVLLEIAVGVVLLIIAFIVFGMMSKQAEMDFEYKSTPSVVWDNERARELYKEGYRPSEYYGDAKSRERAESKLSSMGVHNDD